ncbi:glycoside hydrolase family 5 protein [Tulasnella calospora MUT 4182]|uniref:cellulase n=1 Tax=Tulasnella calospora MUT 4182 TaxID=1051891 RepID=A0A0C3L5X5_9AGAM|nr:glycoside hydrolase family 5 protein [Tulasnella calospora MUT 4182]
MKLSAGLAAVAASLAVSGVAAVPQWGQCGGISYTGDTTCDSPYVCTYQNDYWQCLVGSATATTKTTTSTTKSSTTTTKSSTTTTKSSTTTTTTTTSASPSGTQRFKLFGVNESCAEFGQTKWPGVLGTDYIWPATSSIDFFVGKGFNTFRVAFLMERLNPPATGLTGAFDSTYLNGLKTTVNYITGKGAYAIIDPHNFMRYNNGIISDQTAWTTWWKNLANEFKSNSKVIFDLQNEPWGIDATVVATYMQAAVNAIRSIGATQLILVEASPIPLTTSPSVRHT